MKKENEIIPVLVGGVGEINFGSQYRQGNRVYDADAIAMCLTAQPLGNAGGYSYLYKINQPLACASRGRGKDLSCESSKNSQHLEINYTGVTNALTGVQKDNMIIEPNIIQIGNILPDAHFNNAQRGRIYSPIGLAPALNTMGGGNQEPKIVIDEPSDMPFRIRKLTPTECFRLMGVNDKNIHFIQSCGVSKSQQYKMAGNSIVVDVLEHIFRKLLVDKENENKQMSLF